MMKDDDDLMKDLTMKVDHRTHSLEVLPALLNIAMMA